ncbi:MAG: 6-bladed beta-propeller [Bacteroidales bacterium]|nr:6-bladed beta-propeller [Bacteroidales bacterium]
MKKYLYLLLALIFVQCASTEGTNENSQICVDLGSAMGKMQTLDPSVYGDIIESTFSVKLESPENITIGYLVEVKADENYIYCMDRDWSIYTFDRAGKFIGHISKRGEGPDEYALISDFIPNPEKQEIKVLNYGNNILTYTFDGKFISSLKFPENVSEVTNLGNQFVGYVPFFKDKEHLCILDDSLKIIDTIYPEREIVTPESMSLIPMIQMNGGANYLSYTLPLDLCSYLLMPDGTVKKDIEIKLGDYAAPIEIETSAEKYQEIAMNGPYVLGLWWKHIGNYVFLSYVHEKGNHKVLYSVKKNMFWEDKEEQSKGILVDQETGTYFWPKWYYEDYGICAVEDEESTSLLFVKIK